MLQIEDTIISLDIFDKKFCCDLAQCKGACCIEGESGAPLEKEEIEAIQQALPLIWEDLSIEARKLINQQGVSYQDASGEDVTSIVDGKDCVFTCYDEKGICYCALEKAWRAGKIPFVKPISCHLYPIRLKKLAAGGIALNYQKWSVCASACDCGKQLNMPIYQFLKEPLVRKFGEEWYRQLCLAAEMLKENTRSTHSGISSK